MPNTDRLTRLEGISAIEYRIHHPDAHLLRRPTMLDPKVREIALAEAIGLVQRDQEKLVFCVVLASDG